MKGDIGIKDGLVTGIGRAGNPDIMDGVDLEIGTNTLVRFGAGLIATAGGVDSHVHLVTPKLIPVAVSSGITTLIGGGLSQNAQFKIHRTFEALERMPVNVGLQGLGSATHPAPMLESLEAGACGFKVHEDTGAYPDVIDTCLKVAEAHDVSVALHTDGLQESVHVGETVDAIAGRAVHAYHVEGAGGGHAPDVLELASVPNIIPSSTTPTIPYTVGAHGEHFAMTALIHAVRRHDQAEAAALDDRLRRETMAAEDVLHDLGAIPIINSDSQGMGRIGEVICRTWQLAHKMKAEAGENGVGHDNETSAPVHRQVHDQPGDRTWHLGLRGVDSAREDGGHRAVAARVLRNQAGAGDQGRLHGVGAAGRGQRERGRSRAGGVRAAFRRVRGGRTVPERAVRVGGFAVAWAGATPADCPQAACRAGRSRGDARRHDPQ